MCGIAGILKHPSQCMETLEDDIRNMAQALIHRGPDDSGVWVNKQLGIGLGHRRLAVLDLSEAGHQPMFSLNKRYVIVFNGEIYNFLLIKTELESLNAGQLWRGHSDTEVLLAAIEFWGIEKSLSKLVGMFVFALWDQKDQSLYLVRDRIGEKPLYYGINDRNLFFGSELKAFQCHPAWAGEINRNALALFMQYGYIPAPYSIYHNVFKLLPGTFLKISIQDNLLLSNELPQPISYWSFVDIIKKNEVNRLNCNSKEIIAELDMLLTRSVTKQMIADVPLGAFLSGGTDSTLITAIMQKNSNMPVKSFSLGFDEGDYDEANYAKAVAKYLGTDHTEFYLRPEETESIILDLPHVYDEPFADPSQIPTLLICRLAKQHVTVCLSGDGGDELFGGYDRYMKDTQRWKNIINISPLFRNAISTFLRKTPYLFLDFFLFWTRIVRKCDGKRGSYTSGLLKFGNELRFSNFKQLYNYRLSHWFEATDVVFNSQKLPLMDKLLHEDSDTLAKQYKYMMHLDLLQYLPDDILAKIDRAGMSVGLETRVPFLDHRVVEFSDRIPLSIKFHGGHTKWPLKQLLYKYVPQSLVDRPKMGFGVPIAAWLRGPLREWSEDMLNAQSLKRDGYLNSDLISEKWHEHLKGRHNWQFPLWNVLMFKLWLDNTKN